MKSVLISIQPKWCELIASCKKTIEVRKTAPKLQTPFTCYIYETKGKEKLLEVMYEGDECYGTVLKERVFVKGNHAGCGRVIGKFVCDKIEAYKYSTVDGVDIDDDILLETMLDWEEINTYAKGKPLYGWHISDLKIYDKPKELGEFRSLPFKHCKMKFEKDKRCENGCVMNSKDCTYRKIVCPPQSWRYVEKA